MASRLLRAARNACLASRTAAAAASRAAAMASRSARIADAAADAARAARLGDDSTKSPDDAPSRSLGYFRCSDYAHLPDDAKTPTDKDLESDEAVWALYKRWCKAFNKKRDHAEMSRRFERFRRNAQIVHNWNTYTSRSKGSSHSHSEKKRGQITYFKRKKRLKRRLRRMASANAIRSIRRWGRPISYLIV